MTKPVELKLAVTIDTAGKSSLPDRLTVEGDLDLRETNITELPQHLIVRGNLDLRGTPIKALPTCLVVGGDLLISGSAVSALPERFVVYRYSTRSYRRHRTVRTWWRTIIG
jgi:hypothetical protein